MKHCAVIGCGEELRHPKHRFCLAHWHLEKAGKLCQIRDGEWKVVDVSHDEGRNDAAEFADTSERSTSGMLTSTKLGHHFKLSATRMNLVLAELGWIEKYIKGWTPSEQGSKRGAQVREIRESGVPYVVWPHSILTNKVLVAAVSESLGEPVPEHEVVVRPTSSESSSSGNFRNRFPAEFRATDGHMVRSRGEMLIDNWLYMQGVVHAFERRLPIEEEVYCDFYLPKGKLYIEYWGRENDSNYVARMDVKRQIYHRYHLNLLELTDEHIRNLDDELPRLLLRFGIDCT